MSHHEYPEIGCMYGLVVEDDVRSGTSRASSSIGASEQSGSAPTIERCRDTIERMLGRIKAEDLFATPATASGGASGFKTQSTVGMILNGCAIDSLVVGGPVRDTRAACTVRGCRCASASALQAGVCNAGWFPVYCYIEYLVAQLFYRVPCLRGDTNCAGIDHNYTGVRQRPARSQRYRAQGRRRCGHQ